MNFVDNYMQLCLNTAKTKKITIIISKMLSRKMKKLNSY